MRVFLKSVVKIQTTCQQMWAGIELPVPSCDSSLQYYPVQNTAFEAIIPYSLCVKHVSFSSGDAVLSEKQFVMEDS